MLRSIYISNYALIEESDIVLDKGLNILTGETGAGKSLLLGAIGLILGKRLDYGYIFNPDKKCVVEAVFESLPAGLEAELRKIEDFDWDEEHLVIRREASADGKSRAFVNDTPVNLSVLKDITSLLVDLHGQHQNQMLLAPEFQLRLLDQYAGSTGDAREFGRQLQAMTKTRRQIEELQRDEAAARQQQDYFQFLFQELEAARLDPEEAAQIAQDLGLLEHAGEVKESLAAAVGRLYDEEPSAYSLISDAIAGLERASAMNAQIEQQQKSLQEARILVQEAARALGHIDGGIDLDPRSLEAMQARSELYSRLQRKFNADSVEALVALREEYRTKAGQSDALGEQVAGLQKELSAQAKALGEAGKALEAKRLQVAKALAPAVDGLLQQVGLDNAKFEVHVGRNAAADGPLELDGQRIQAHPHGINAVEFRIRTNAGMPMGALGQIASGGEVSRVMLAIKAALAEKAELSVLIFDEIDTGISGEVANKVGRVMAQLARRYQLIAITHLPQIAAKGDQHYRISKDIQDGKTQSRVDRLDEEGRVMELAHMLSGADPSESAIRNAKELITSGKD
jgi:DNA repair protein RecN (Recombination protein N)